MFTTNRLYLSVLLIAVLAVVPIWSASAQDPDQVDSVDPLFIDHLNLISEMTVPNVLIEFDDMPQGPTTIEDILNTFPDSCLGNITITSKQPPFVGSSGIYNSNTGGGRALALNPDNSGGLYLVDPGGLFRPNDDIVIDLIVPVRQIGIELGDVSGTMSAEFFNGAVSLGTIGLPISSVDRTNTIESDIAFNRVVISSPFAPDLIDFVMPSVRVQLCNFVRPIPTLSEWGLIAMAGVLGIIAILAIRRRKAAA